MAAFPTLTSAAPTPEAVSQQQDILQRQREKQLREQMQPEQDVRLDGTNTGMEKMATEVGGANSDEASPCFPISEVELVGEEAAKFRFALNHALRQTHFVPGKCLHADDINQIMSLAQNALIGRGYTTTRILAAPQDLNSGKLQLTLMPGYLRSIRIDRSNDDQTHAGRIAAFQNKFPTRSNNLLNLRDLEQGLENLKRLPTAEADLQIVPVEGEPNQSDVGADVGHVSGQSAQWLSGQTLAGTAVGIRGQMKLGGNLHYDIFTGRALKKPESFQSRKWASGFQISYTF